MVVDKIFVIIFSGNLFVQFVKKQDLMLDILIFFPK
jgi:hypothetical protein